jgi:hypothetical protein
MADLATRLLLMSPDDRDCSRAQVAEALPQGQQISNPCVGCSWRPSPALITGTRTALASSSAPPEADVRTTNACTPIA